MNDSNDTASLKTLSFFCRELNPIGSRALSHDSIFIPEEPVAEPNLDHSMSQENVSDKVRNLQVSPAVNYTLIFSHLLSAFILRLLLGDRAEADSTRHKVWPEASVSEEE